MEPYIASQQSQKLKLDFASSFYYVDRAVEEILNFIQDYQIKVKKFELNLIVREVLNNAVEHGNQHEFCRRVRCQMWVEHDALHIKVEDEGEGFDWRHDQRSDLDTMQDGGKGLLLIQTFGFDVSRNDKGNVIFLRRSLI